MTELDLLRIQAKLLGFVVREVPLREGGPYDTKTVGWALTEPGVPRGRAQVYAQGPFLTTAYERLIETAERA